MSSSGVGKWYNANAFVNKKIEKVVSTAIKIDKIGARITPHLNILPSFIGAEPMIRLMNKNDMIWGGNEFLVVGIISWSFFGVDGMISYFTIWNGNDKTRKQLL